MMMRTVTVTESGVQAAYEVHTFGQGSPCIFFTAGVHGNEVSGIYVARQLIQYFTEHAPLRGTVKIIPTVNATAMRCMQRRSPFDGQDLNRIFPGNEQGSLSHRLAASVFNETAGADILVDLHCCGQHGMPYILSIYSESEKAKKMVERITMPIAIHSEGTAGQLFTEACRRRDQAACVIELPSGRSSGAVNLPVAEQCFEALLDLLASEGVVEKAQRGSAPKFYGSLKEAYAHKAGLWRPQVEKGMEIVCGQVIGTVDGEPVHAPESGMAMSVMPCGYIFEDELYVMIYTQPNG